MESTWHAAGAQEMRADFESGGDSGEGGMMPNHPATCVGFPSSPRQAKHQCAQAGQDQVVPAVGTGGQAGDQLVTS